MNKYYVYILGNRRGTIYTGTTNDLERRIHEHKTKAISGFASKYNIDRLLFFDEFSDLNEAYEAEKKIKGWNRKKKLDLIRERNPTFRDLSEDWGTR